MSQRNPRIHYSKKLSAYSTLRHGVTLRGLGDNYDRLAQEEGIQASNIVTLQQIHSNRILCIDSHSNSVGRNIAEGDALITSDRGLVLGIRTADCVSVLLYDPSQSVVAAIHAGWRGIVANIVINTVQTMQDRYGSRSQDVVAFVGPSICKDCFEVGPEVVREFEKRYPDNGLIKKGMQDRSFIDLKKAVERDLIQSGVPCTNIETSSLCTYCQHEKLYSFRKGDKDPRMLTFVGLL